jgi:hypothetical protein
MRAKAPSLSATADRYESYSTALISYAGVLESSLWELSTARRELAWRHDAAGRGAPRATAAVAVADVDSAPELLTYARRFKGSYDQWADAVERCASALLQANDADPTRDLHGLKALGHNIGTAAKYVDPLGEFLLHPSWKSLSDCLGVLSTELTILGLGLLFIFPPAGAACFAVATALSVAQVGVDTYRKSHGEHISNGTLGLEALGAIPVFGKFAKPGLKAAEHLAPVAERLTVDGIKVTEEVAPRVDALIEDTIRDGARFEIVPGGTTTRDINFRPNAPDPRWGLTAIHVDKHFFGAGKYSLKVIDPAGNTATWLGHIQDLASRPVTRVHPNGVQTIIGKFAKSDGTGSFKFGIRISPNENGSYHLVTLLTGQ